MVRRKPTSEYLLLVCRSPRRISLDIRECRNFLRLAIFQDPEILGFEPGDVVTLRVGDNCVHLYKVDRYFKDRIRGGNLRRILGEKGRGCKEWKDGPAHAVLTSAPDSAFQIIQFLRDRSRDANRREPVIAVRLCAVHDPEELVLEFFGDRTAVAGADADAVDGTIGEISAAVPVKKTSSAI